MSLQGLVCLATKKYHDKTAVIFDDGLVIPVPGRPNCKGILQITYHELGENVQELKNILTNFLREGQIVAVFLKPSCHLPSILLSVLLSQCAFFPVSSDGLWYSMRGIQKVKASWLLFHSSYEKAVLSTINYPDPEVISTDILLKYQLKLVKLSDASATPPPTEFGPIAYCITTSGTTSSPKVVKVPQSCIVPNILSLRDIFNVKCTDRFLLSSPLTFDPSMIDIFLSLSSGAGLLIVPDEVKRNPAKLLHVIHDRQAVTIMQATPSLIARFSPYYLRRTLLGAKTSLRVLALGGEQFPTGEEIRKWTDPTNRTQFFNLYGITEVSCWASCEHVNIQSLKEHNKSAPIGKALDKTLVKISSDRSSIPNEGNIMIGSAERVCIIDNGDASDDEATTKMYGICDSDSRISDVQHNNKKVIWRDSGDSGRLMPDGSIIYLGRKDDQIKRNGKRLNISAIEEVCCQLQSISDCKVLLNQENCLAAFVIVASDQSLATVSSPLSREQHFSDGGVTIEDSYYKQRLLSADATDSIGPTRVQDGNKTELTSGENLHTDETDRMVESKYSLFINSTNNWEKIKEDVIRHVKLSLPSHYMPDVFVEVSPAFPVTAHGKLDKKSLLKMAGIYQFDSSLMLKSPQAWALQLWLVFLPVGVEEVQADDNFLALGGDSLAALGLINTLEKFINDAALDFLDIVFNKPFGHFVEKIKEYLQSEFSKKSFDGRTLNPGKTAEIQLVTDTAIGNPDNDHHHHPSLYSTEEKFPNSVVLDNSGDKFLKRGKEILIPDFDSENVPYDYKSDSVLHQDTPQRFRVSSGRIGKIVSRGSRIIVVEGTPQVNFTQSVHHERHHDLQPQLGNIGIDAAAKSALSVNTLKCYAKNEPCHNQISRGDNTRKQFQTDEFLPPENFLECDEDKTFESAEVLHHLKLAWKYDTKKCVDASPVIAVFENKTLVLTGSHSGHFSAIDLNSGNVIWTAALPDRIESSACCTLNMKFVVVGCYDGGIYSLNSLSGSVDWCFKTQDIVKCSPMVDGNSGHVMCGSHDGTVYCLDIENKKCVWQKFLNGGGILASPLVKHGNNITFVATLRGKIWALKIDDGQSVWCIDLKKPVFSSPCFHNKSILIGCTDNILYCISDTGSIDWKFNAKGPIFSSPVSHRNHIFFGCHDCHMYCLNSMGLMKWSAKGFCHSTFFSTPFVFQSSRKTYDINSKCTNKFCTHRNLLKDQVTGLCSHAEISSPPSSPTQSNKEFVHRKRLTEFVHDDPMKPDCDALILNEPQKKVAKYFSSEALNSTSKDESSGSFNSLQIDQLQSRTGNSREANPCDQSAIKNSSGENVANVESQIDVESSIREGNSGMFVFAASSNGTLYLFDSVDGRRILENVLPGEVFSSPVVCNNKVVVGCRDNFIYCYDFFI